MATRAYKPTTPGRRGMTVPSFEEVTKFSPEKKLLTTLKKHAGRNSYGRITVRHHGGGNKIKYRLVDFERQVEGKATVIGVEYDPNRTAYIALVEYEDGTRKYILAPAGLTDGDVIESGAAADIKVGNTLPIANIPVGTLINNIEHDTVKVGKAGKTRHKGVRPTVRGSVMNPCDHPHGGGEGRSPIGRPGPVTPWGKPALGYKTRNKKARTDKFIVKRRNGK